MDAVVVAAKIAATHHAGAHFLRLATAARQSTASHRIVTFVPLLTRGA
jgi:hypothetical protein